ncbi:MAG: sigma-54-dependent Fis family transcriptional regulator [Lewinellaceae bacterium]|nr:sigma-54-dependent Fis family transcriptional regulator [Saprospiraceae bacterium]MCB9340540.1 sigma-54-dependent Fis family transcriptional regulator [Lewinellaceae bacterium]
MSSLQSIKQRFGIIGNSPLLDRALDTAARVATTDLTVLITGESGVGKENISKIIHALSARKHNQFIAVNCGAIPAGTINSELFGHEKGAFTGATNDRKGYFETADTGTIFLDEISEMPLDTQAFLLRILESGEFIRVGSSKVQTTDVRVIAATNVNLEERMRKGKFREDLYYRLNTVPINVPALNERREDIYLLFRKFANDMAERYRIDPVRLDEQARFLLENYRWPGNVRELKNVAEQISILSENRLLSAEDLVSMIPNIGKRNLPMIPDTNEYGGENFKEREILFKFLFEMKNDLNDLKNLVFELVNQNDLQMPDTSSYRALNHPAFNKSGMSTAMAERSFENHEHANEPLESRDSQKPIIIGQPDKPFHQAEVVEESLNIIDMEKDLILKALKKHHGRRKEAASDLGISERTLYRKIKEYDLQ